MMEVLGRPGVVTVVFRYVALICGLVEVAARMTQMFGLTMYLLWLPAFLTGAPPRPHPLHHHLFFVVFVESVHLSDERDTDSRRALFPDNMWKGVGAVWKGHWDCAQFSVCCGEDVSRRCLLTAVCYQR